MVTCDVAVPQIKWRSPRQGMIKLNTDAAVVGDLGFVGIRVVFLDSTRSVLAASAKRLNGNFAVDDTEMLVIRDGL